MGALLAQVVPFVHPALAAWAPALGLIPILIHLINRRRYRRVPWAAMRFLLAARRRSARRIRLEQWLLLALRVAAVILLGLAAARPYFPATAQSPLASSRAHRVLLIDDSLSMRARVENGETRFDLALAGALRLLDTFPPGDAVSIVTLAQPAEALIGHAAYDRRFVRERLASVEPTQRVTDVHGAVTSVLDILRDSTAVPENRFIYLFSDLTQRDYAGSASDPSPAILALRTLADALPAPASALHVFMVAPATPPNLALTDLSCDTSLVGVHVPVRLSITVSNLSAVTVRDIALQVRRDGEIIRRQPLSNLAPGAQEVATVTTSLPAPGTHLIEARITNPRGDALNEDDSRVLSLDAREAVAVLLVDGQPGATVLGGQAGYLATALAPEQYGSAMGSRATGRHGSRRPYPGYGQTGPATTSLRRAVLSPSVIGETELAAEILADYGIVALCNVSRLSAEHWRRLAEFVSAGGGLFVFAGGRVSIDNYNRSGYADGRGVLPVPFERAVAPTTGMPTGISPVDLEHAIVAPLSEYRESGLFRARVDRYIPVDFDASRAELVLRYLDGAPALLASHFGKGKVLVCTTTAGMDWTNLPAKGDYVSLMHRAFSYLAPAYGDHRNLQVGGTVEEPLTPRETSLVLRITDAAGTGSDVTLVPSGDGLAVRYGPVERAGTISVAVGAEVRHFAANVDTRESALATVEPEAFEAALERPVRLITEPGGAGELSLHVKAGELGSAALWLVILLLFAESTLGLLLGSHRAAPAPAHRGDTRETRGG